MLCRCRWADTRHKRAPVPRKRSRGKPKEDRSPLQGRPIGPAPGREGAVLVRQSEEARRGHGRRVERLLRGQADPDVEVVFVQQREAAKQARVREGGTGRSEDRNTRPRAPSGRCPGRAPYCLRPARAPRRSSPPAGNPDGPRPRAPLTGSCASVARRARASYRSRNPLRSSVGLTCIPVRAERSSVASQNAASQRSGCAPP